MPEVRAPNGHPTHASTRNTSVPFGSSADLLTASSTPSEAHRHTMHGMHRIKLTGAPPVQQEEAAKAAPSPQPWGYGDRKLLVCHRKCATNCMSWPESQPCNGNILEVHLKNGCRTYLTKTQIKHSSHEPEDGYPIGTRLFSAWMPWMQALIWCSII